MAGVVNAQDGVGVNFGAQDVLRNGQVYGPGPAGNGGFEGLVQNLRDTLRMVDRFRVFAQGRRDGNLVQILKVPETGGAGGSASGDQQHRGAVEMGVADTGERVDVRHAAADGADAHGATEASDGFGDISCGLFIAHVDKPHSRPVAGVVQVVQPVAAEGCDKGDAFFLKFRHQQIRTVHVRSSRETLKGCPVKSEPGLIAEGNGAGSRSAALCRAR